MEQFGSKQHILFFCSCCFPSAAGGERDVAFLIDGTDNVRADFPYIRDFIIKVIEPLDIGIDKVRVSVVQHSERPSPSFYLNTYQTKDEVIRAVNGLSVAGGRSLNTGAALRFMKDTIFSERQGSRTAQNVPQFLIVLSGSRSRDNVKEPAGSLKTEGVVPFGVGVKDADPKQIEAISHNPSFAFNVKEFSELSTIPGQLNTYVSLPKEQLEVVLQQGRNKLFCIWRADLRSENCFCQCFWCFLRMTESYLLCLSTKQCCKKRYCLPSGWL